MIMEGLEVIHEFKCSCKICTRGIGPHFEDAEQVITEVIKSASKNIDFGHVQQAQKSLKMSFEQLNIRKSPTFNDYTLDSFVATHILELIAYQCSFPFFSK